MVIDAIARFGSMMDVCAVSRAVRIDVTSSKVLMNWDIATGDAGEADSWRRGCRDDWVRVRHARVRSWSGSSCRCIRRDGEAPAGNWRWRWRWLIIIDAVTDFRSMMDVSRVLWAVSIDVRQCEVRLNWDVSARHAGEGDGSCG